MTNDKTKKHTTLRMRRDLLALLDEEARKRTMSRNQLFEQVMAGWLAKQGFKTGVMVRV